MDAKLTLNIDKDVARKAKVYAKKEGRSLSDLVENYLKLLTKNSTIEDSEYSPRVKSLLGSISLPMDFDYKKELADSLATKYL
jgi:predicted CopG family antitoxin